MSGRHLSRIDIRQTSLLSGLASTNAFREVNVVFRPKLHFQFPISAGRPHSMTYCFSWLQWQMIKVMAVFTPKKELGGGIDPAQLCSDEEFVRIPSANSMDREKNCLWYQFNHSMADNKLLI